MERRKIVVYNILNVLTIYALPLFCMVAACMAKGSENIANSIWNSWQPLFKYQGIISPTPGAGVAFLEKPIQECIMMHLNLNYGIETSIFGFDPYLVFGSLFMFICIYYFVVRIPSLKGQTKGIKILLSDMYIFQFICLLPMFTILSCDFGRTINYAIYTTYFLAYFIEKYQIKYHLPIIHMLSKDVCEYCDNSVMSNIWFYIIVLFLTPFSPWGGVSIFNPLIIEYIKLISIVILS